MRKKNAHGPSKIRDEKIKVCLEKAMRKEDPDSTNWDRLTKLVRLCFKEQCVPIQLSWLTVVLIPKGSDNYRGISLREIIWKVTDLIVNWRIANKVSFRNFSHGFVAKQGREWRISKQNYCSSCHRQLRIYFEIYTRPMILSIRSNSWRFYKDTERALIS